MSNTPPISWETKAYGWEGALTKLNADRNDYDKPRGVRIAADKAHAKILRNLEDTELMGMRERLIKATQAGDYEAIKRITQQMRAYNHEDQETGQY